MFLITNSCSHNVLCGDEGLNSWQIENLINRIIFAVISYMNYGADVFAVL